MPTERRACPFTTLASITPIAASAESVVVPPRAVTSKRSRRTDELPFKIVLLLWRSKVMVKSAWNSKSNSKSASVKMNKTREANENEK